jgi:spiro-SPASM protein
MVFNGNNAVEQTFKRARLLPGVRHVVLLLPLEMAQTDEDMAASAASFVPLTLRGLLKTLGEVSVGYDCVYFAWADCPFLDVPLATALSERHVRYGADYTYADGYPYGLAPELLAPDLPAKLLALLGEGDGQVERDSIFATLQRDINAFDIETELAPEDLRIHRLTLCADTARNLLLLTRWAAAGFSGTADAGRLIRERPELLRTLPAFYSIQVSGVCPQACVFCPYPRRDGGVTGLPAREDYLSLEQFALMLDKIEAFSGDAVISLSLWGELGLHERKVELIDAVLRRPNLALIVETSGLGWTRPELEELAAMARDAPPRTRAPSPIKGPLTWVVSLDAQDAARYRTIRGDGYEEAVGTTEALLELFPQNVYVQALRLKDAEDDIERFYRSWKERGAEAIIQKYDSFCGAMPEWGATDLSPLMRRPCWHLMRDMSVLIDGTVPLCREELGALSGIVGRGATDDVRTALGNILTDDLDTIWRRGEPFYEEQCRAEFNGQCARCDEYYTYNF